MTGLEYQAPASVDDAVGLLARFQGDARVLAGGTDLLVQLRSGRLKPGLVVDVKHIPEMREIKDAGDHFWVGGAVSCAELGEHEVIGAAWPGVVEASDPQAEYEETVNKARAALGAIEAARRR